MSFLFLPIVFLAPVVGFVAGFLVGTFRPASVRLVAALILIASPIAYLSMPLILSTASPSARFAAGFALTIFGLHIALWMLFATLGVFVGAARGSRGG